MVLQYSHMRFAVSYFGSSLDQPSRSVPDDSGLGLSSVPRLDLEKVGRSDKERVCTQGTLGIVVGTTKYSFYNNWGLSLRELLGVIPTAIEHNVYGMEF